jgi:uncharacterized lipoprotein YbaY
MSGFPRVAKHGVKFPVIATKDAPKGELSSEHIEPMNQLPCSLMLNSR